MAEKEKDHEEVLKFIQKHQGSSVLVFTDGSVYKGPVGCGACAATLLPLSHYGKECTECHAVATNVDILTCNIEGGIVLGLELVNPYINDRGNSGKSESVYILSDCTVAIDIVTRSSKHYSRPDLIRKIKRLEDSLLEMNISVVVALVQHIIRLKYEKVDRQAREMAYDIFKENISAPGVISFHSAVKLPADIVMKSWHRKWELETAGYYTIQLIPEVGRKVMFPVVGISYCRMLLNYTMLNDDANRTGTAQSPVCEC